MHIHAEHKCANLLEKYQAEERVRNRLDLLSLNPISGHKSSRAKRIIVT